MSSSIAETVNGAPNQAGLGQYQSHARPVVEALNTREQSMAEQLITFATQQGLSEEDASAALRQIGMTLPNPPAIGTVASADAANQTATMEAEGGDNADLGTVLARINATLEDLAGFARQNGWTPTR